MYNDLGRYISRLLRHHPEQAWLTMDIHGYVEARQLIENLQAQGRNIDRGILETIVATDNKGRFRFSADGARIKACQGHSIPWVIPELTYPEPPKVLYHGTTLSAWNKIRQTGAILRMERHAVHMRADPAAAWRSGARWHEDTVLLEIDAEALARDGHRLGVTENDVWCLETVPVQYVRAAHHSLRSATTCV